MKRLPDIPPGVDAASDETAPLAAEHRRLLLGEARTYALMSLLPAFPLLLLLVFALSPESAGHGVVIWPLIALCGVALAVCLSSCRACVMDARAGYAEVRVRRLRQRRDSPRYPTSFDFDDGPEHARLPTSWLRPSLTPEGAWYRIVYSPRSATLWAIEPASEPQVDAGTSAGPDHRSPPRAQKRSGRLRPQDHRRASGG